MKLFILDNPAEVGKASAKHAAELINQAIKEKGNARILLSTGASQFAFFEEFVKEDIDWNCVEMFHLDEYVGISASHSASFKHYLTERFVDKVHPGKVHLIDGEKNPEMTIKELTELLNEQPVDVGLIGIGENAHIAFNDPPADFDDDRAYKIVTLDQRCLQQQVGEGWFKTIDETYKQAISMTCKQIMKCKHIISVVPYKVKAEAIYNTLANEETNKIPATLMKKHKNFTIYCDEDSASMLTSELKEKYC